MYVRVCVCMCFCARGLILLMLPRLSPGSQSPCRQMRKLLANNLKQKFNSDKHQNTYENRDCEYVENEMNNVNKFVIKATKQQLKILANTKLLNSQNENKKTSGKRLQPCKQASAITGNNSVRRR